MSMQRLSERTCRRIERHTGIKGVTEGWAQGWRFAQYTHQVKDVHGQMWLVNPHNWDKITFEVAKHLSDQINTEKFALHNRRMANLQKMLADPPQPKTKPIPRKPLPYRVRKWFSDRRYAKATKRWNTWEDSAITVGKLRRAGGHRWKWSDLNDAEKAEIKGRFQRTFPGDNFDDLDVKRGT